MLIEPMLQRLRAARDLAGALRVALADVVALHGAERGNIQLFNAQGQLLIVRQSGLSREFIDTFQRLAIDDGSVCGRAALLQQTVFVPDVEHDADFAPFRGVARAVPFRSVLSSPLVAPQAGCIGIASVHFANRFTPSALELHSLEAYCRELARTLCTWHSPAELHTLAESLATGLVPAS